MRATILGHTSTNAKSLVADVLAVVAVSAGAEGVIVGFLGGLLAVPLLTIANETLIDPLSEDFALLAAPDTIDFRCSLPC